MITIFCHFLPFLAKILAFFSKTNVMMKFVQKLTLNCAKTSNVFATFFQQKYFCNYNIDPLVTLHGTPKSAENISFYRKSRKDELDKKLSGSHFLGMQISLH
jgi:hypothetical protein